MNARVIPWHIPLDEQWDETKKRAKRWINTAMAAWGNSASTSYTSLSANASDLPSVSIPTDPFLRIYVRVAGYTVSGFARLQFNGDTGTTAYSYTVTTLAPAGTFTTKTAAAASAAGIVVSAVSIAGPRSLIVFDVRNISGQAHGISYQSADVSETAATAPSVTTGAGIWTTTSLISRVNLNVGENGGLLTSGTDMLVVGTSTQ